MSKRLAVVAVVIGLLVAVGLAVQALRMHDESGEWRLTHSPTPLRIDLAGRDYQRSDLPPVRLPEDSVVKGRTEGGGVIYVQQPDDLTPLVVYVGSSRATTTVLRYGLVGGP